MPRRFDHLPDVEAFIAVVKGGSMSEAAVAMSTTASVLSRAITRLETRLGVQLLRRTTRRLSLTDAGRHYFAEVGEAFSQINAAENEIRREEGASDQVAGRVRMSVPTTYGHHRLPPMLARFLRQYPQIDVELSITNRNVDLVAEGYDIAIRLGSLRDTGLTVHKLEDAPMRLVASRNYVDCFGMPATLGDLANHRLLPFVIPSTGRFGHWTLRIDGRDVEWAPAGRVHVLDDVLGCVSLAEQGAGICQSYDFIVSDRLAQGTLVEVLPEWGGATRPFSMLFASHRHLSPATRRMVDFLASEAASRPGQ